MEKPAETRTAWRNRARHEAPFDVRLARGFGRLPAWLVSAGLHALAAGIVFQAVVLPVGPGPDLPPGRLRAECAPPLPLDVEPLPDEEACAGGPAEALESPRAFDDGLEEVAFEAAEEPRREACLGEADLDAVVTIAPRFPAIGVGGIGGGAGGCFRGLRSMGAGAPVGGWTFAGLQWLSDRQRPDGSWAAGSAEYDAGVSGLAVLALLSGGESHRRGRHKKTVKAGLRYLKSIQDPEGCFGPRTSRRFVYNHAIATLAMVEAFAATGSPLLGESAEAGIGFLERCRNPGAAWRYGERPGDNDLSVTGWAVLALHSARAAGLPVEEGAFADVLAWLSEVTDPKTGRAGYLARGTGPGRPLDRLDLFPPEASESLTAAAVLTRILGGEDPAKSRLLRKGVALCLACPPRREPGATDLYYWFYGTVALYHAGGDAWREWRETLRTAVIAEQVAEGPERGSWDPVGPWGREGGRVYATALSLICADYHHRQARVIPVGR